MKRFAVVIAATVCLAAGWAADGARQSGDKALQIQTMDLKSLPRRDRLGLVDQIRKVRGYFSRKSVPLIVDDIKRMSERRILPRDAYALLGGALPDGLNQGDEIEATARLVKPRTSDLKSLQSEETFLMIEKPGDVKVLTRSTQERFKIDPERIVGLATIEKGLAPAEPGVRYGLLVDGGYNAANYWVSFYNDLVISYNLLLGHGYQAGDIIVLNADGGGPPKGEAPCGKIPVDGAATSAELNKAFGKLAGRMRAEDSLTVMFTDHGGPGTICLWGEELSGRELARMLGRLPRVKQIMLSFDLCFSGGLVENVLGPNRLIYAACDAGLSGYDSIHGPFGALTFALVSAFAGRTPMGVSVDADADHDGRVSMAEAFNWARLHVDATGRQTFHYNDDISMPDAIGRLPRLTDGVLGAKRYL